MRRDQTVARIVLVLSIVHGALAVPVVIRQRYLDVVEEVTAGSEKRSSDESPHPGSEAARDETGDSYFTARSSLSSSNGYLTTPVSGAREFHNDPPPGSGTLQTRDDQPVPGTSGTPPSQDHPLAGSGAPPTQDHPLAGLGTPQSQDHPLAGSGAPQLHNDPTISTSGAPQVHNDLSPGEFDESHRWLNGYRFPGATPPESLQSEGSQPMSGTQQTMESEANRDFNGARNKNLKLFGGIIVGLAIYGGLVYGLDKMRGPSGPTSASNGSKPVGRDLANSDVVYRGASMHSRSPKKTVSRTLANLMTRDEDLELLGVPTSRALERLD